MPTPQDGLNASNWPHTTQGQTELVTACERTKGARALREETPRASRDQAMTRGTELRRARSATRAAHTTRAHSRAQSIQEDRPPAVLAFAHLVSFCINRVGLSARRRRRRHQVGRHQIDDRRWHRLFRRRRVGVGNLLELPAAAVLLCGCRSWLPVIAVTGSSSVATRFWLFVGSPSTPTSLSPLSPAKTNLPR